jgi:N utilization substance protein B
MISRRILRIKVLQTIYSYYQKGDANLIAAEKELAYSIAKSYDLYFYIMQLAIDVCDHANKQLQAAMRKHLSSETDKNPNMKFVNNSFIAQLRDNVDLQKHINATKLTWSVNPEVPKSVYEELIASEEYAEYMSHSKPSYDADKWIVSFMIEKIVLDNNKFYDALSDQSIYWIDTAEFFIGMVLRTFARMKESSSPEYKLMPMYKSDDDRTFAIQLLHTAVGRREEYRKRISDNAQNWDLDRIAFLDIIILQTAIAEIEQFPEIPLRVTFNEYIELAKNYSTEKSPTFVNGILDKIVQGLTQEGRINKIAEMPTQYSNQ